MFKDPKSIRKALYVAQNIASKIDPAFSRVPLPEIAKAGGGEISHRAYGGRNNENDNIWWHGSVSGDMRGGKTGLHLGTKAAAEDALHASIGFPAEGTWDGTREYGKTLLAGKENILKRNKYGLSGRNMDAPEHDYYAHEHPEGPLKYSNGDLVPLDSKPSIRPFKIVGPMTNTIDSPHDDFKANGYMSAALKKKNAKQGYFYKNVGEDSGSISAVVPNENHVSLIDEKNSDITKASGGFIHEPEKAKCTALMIARSMHKAEGGDVENDKSS
ncbi:MAG: hypothetical protein EB015_15065, partial [Methylocystaceae bacterium]|nr:hypothetical protein [Methylocystaceae bacterium]